MRGGGGGGWDIRNLLEHRNALFEPCRGACHPTQLLGVVGRVEQHPFDHRSRAGEEACLDATRVQGIEEDRRRGDLFYQGTFATVEPCVCPCQSMQSVGKGRDQPVDGAAEHLHVHGTYM